MIVEAKPARIDRLVFLLSTRPLNLSYDRVISYHRTLVCRTDGGIPYRGAMLPRDLGKGNQNLYPSLKASSRRSSKVFSCATGGFSTVRGGLT